MIATKASFLAKAKGFKRLPVEIDGDTFHVREVSAAEAKEYAKRQADKSDELELAAWLAVQVLCDESGNRLLGNEDVESVKQMPLRILKEVGQAAAKVSGWKQADEAKNDASGS